MTDDSEETPLAFYMTLTALDTAHATFSVLLDGARGSIDVDVGEWVVAGRPTRIAVRPETPS